MLSSEQIQQFHEEGYIVISGLFSPAEVEMYKHHFMAMNKTYVSTEIKDANDPLARYPRIMQPHRTDAISREWLIDSRLDAAMTDLLGTSPYAVQTMFYFKPAGARGQALHQDQFYLRVEPGTCIAAWMAVDRCDEENGCLQVVPRTHTLPTLCTVDADSSVSFAGDTVILPEGMTPIPVIMEPGDVLFFNGQLVHGSYPNSSQDRFRRSLIGHYIVAEAEKVSKWYHPVLRMDGSEVEMGVSPFGGPCGVWTEENGAPVAKLDGIELRQKQHE